MKGLFEGTIWQVWVGILTLIPGYIFSIKVLSKRKVGLNNKIHIVKERGNYTTAMILKEDAYRITRNRGNSAHGDSYWSARYTYKING